jgi:hypothetical protein
VVISVLEFSGAISIRELLQCHPHLTGLLRDGTDADCPERNPQADQ